MNKDGKLIVILPADNITLNKRPATGIKAVKRSGIKGYELWTFGSVSPAARKFIQESGWKLKQQIGKEIGFIVQGK